MNDENDPIDATKRERDAEDRASRFRNWVIRAQDPHLVKFAHGLVDSRAEMPVLILPTFGERAGDGNRWKHQAYNGYAMRRLAVVLEMRRYARESGAEPEYIAYLDGDVEETPAWLSALAADESYLDGIDEVAVNQSYDALKLLED